MYRQWLSKQGAKFTGDAFLFFAFAPKKTMKLSLTILLLLSVASTSLAATMGPIRSGKALESLLKKSRRLDQGEDDYSFLQNYQLKFISCKGGQLTQNENGKYVDTASVVVFRLCPNDGCDSDITQGCNSGYGDYVVSLNNYVQAYFEDQRENREEDENFRVDEYLECGEYEVQNEGEGEQGENEQEGENQNENNVAYYIGPTCTDDGTDAKFELFTDDACSTVSSDVTFYELSGMDLPYSSGGLVSTSCSSCYGQNDNGEYEVSEFCEGLYELSYGCETNMETYSANGKDESHCDYINQLTGSKKKTGGGRSASGAGAGWTIFWVIFAVAVLGVVGFVLYLRKSTSLTQVCLVCYCCVLSNLLPCRCFVNTEKATESESDYKDGLMQEEKSGGFFSKWRFHSPK